MLKVSKRGVKKRRENTGNTTTWKLRTERLISEEERKYITDEKGGSGGNSEWRREGGRGEGVGERGMIERIRGEERGV